MKLRITGFLVALLFGCSSSEPSATPAVDSSTATDADGPKTPDASCVRPGDKGNEKGIGTACTPLGKECDGFPGAPSCLADLGQDQWMCTRIGCTTNDQCGANAVCHIESDGSACVPSRCLDGDDAGSDASADVSAEASADASAEASTDAPGG